MAFAIALRGVSGTITNSVTSPVVGSTFDVRLLLPITAERMFR